jgi:hypothetical protein
MKICPVCRESLPENLTPGIPIQCQSCFVEINIYTNGLELSHDTPSLINTQLALTRAIDRLTKQLADNAKKQGQRDLAEMFGLK